MIRFGIIGTNWITESLIEAASQLDNFALTAVYSRKKETAETFAAKHNAEHTFTDIHEFAASDAFDAVYIASPNSLHAEQAIICIQHGKHVLCEKPIASNEKEVTRMIAEAKKHNVVLMEALKSLHMPNFLAIKENLHKIGKVRRYFASYCQYSSRYDKYKNGEVLNAFRPEFSNGSIMDIGIYCVAPAIALFGEPSNVSASSYLLDSGVDGKGSMILQYDEMDAVLMYSKITNSYVPSEIQGENGSILIDKISTPENVMIQYKDGTKEDITVSQSDKNMVYEVEKFITFIQESMPPTEYYEYSLSTIKVLDKARNLVGLRYPADQL
ncbi:Gfo/Idh/MocA family protein [Mangrovibacillus cuniculi]|uniref:Gfo/Idh/MocA family oxidoreductase n=1 Tax=Mangrovibacillus cuniculi TaxID=2593652 RepID=A0A7S8C9X8_9BACI|nr:Gfo/Idh/MocA family oxidoreductase [Mangrovibacillus cuniculi]QPC46109.1 Gfo/Idh/MocA family oxidoreductase [Mangrovibacillus cuniculi]